MKNYLLILMLACFGLFSCKNDMPKSNQEQNHQKESLIQSISLEKIWQSDTLLTTAESVIYDADREVFYVACINGVSPWVHDGDGFIAKMDKNGGIIKRKWVEGLSGPKGMGINRDTLIVTNIDEVVYIDIEEGEIIRRVKIDTGENINDLTVANDGDVFVSDSKAAAIYKITGDEVSLMLQDTSFKGINGVFMEDDTLYFATYNQGSMYRIQHGDLNPRKLVELPSGGDGVERYQGGFIVSSWPGMIFYVDNNWNVSEILNTADQKINSADIEVVEDLDLLLVPTFFDNRVVAYKINK